MYKVDLERTPTVINEYRYLNNEGRLVVSTTPIYANQITLDYKKEYGDLRYTDYFIHRPTKDTIGVVTKMYNNSYEPYYFFSGLIKVGMLAVYDMYNFKYLGEVKSIGDKTVTITAYKGHEYNEKNHRLNFYTFAMYNGQYNVDKWIKENREVSYTI